MRSRSHRPAGRTKRVHTVAKKAAHRVAAEDAANVAGGHWSTGYYSMYCTLRSHIMILTWIRCSLLNENAGRPMAVTSAMIRRGRKRALYAPNAVAPRHASEQ